MDRFPQTVSMGFIDMLQRASAVWCDVLIGHVLYLHALNNTAPAPCPDTHERRHPCRRRDDPAATLAGLPVKQTASGLCPRCASVFTARAIERRQQKQTSSS
jgi:hypothetical protein